MTERRVLGAGPQAPAAPIRAAQADLLHSLPGVRLPDLDELRDRGVLGSASAQVPPARRSLGNGGCPVEEPPGGVSWTLPTDD
ncbi:hypothetical protein [Streptomyces sp. NPDC048659]|uniref:hypothetical protein n=1 Tax=Streptomyces sp. NPDC048659 TaxID=3155489 RepID=UPI0034155C8F